MNSMPSDQTYRPVSFWLDTVPGSLAPGEVLPGDLTVDVAIAGAGLTGLWTAYYLATAQPGLRIAVCEALPLGQGRDRATGPVGDPAGTRQGRGRRDARIRFR